jgi:hypothetical protein
MHRAAFISAGLAMGPGAWRFSAQCEVLGLEDPAADPNENDKAFRDRLRISVLVFRADTRMEKRILVMHTSI